MKTKRCTKCGKRKAVEEFSKNKNAKDGLRSWCKECCSEYEKIYYTNNPEQYERQKANSNKRHANNFIEALCHYSEPDDPWFLHCVCEISDVDLLTMDHINNDGHIYNKKGRRLSGFDLAKELRKRGWPEEIKIQILCFNCNRKKERDRSRQQAVIDNSKRSEENRKNNEDRNEYYHRVRLETLRHYGPNGEAKCCRCSEDDFDVLDLDHINGRGKRNTPFEKLSGVNLVAWLKRDNWPDVPLQVLCQNCNHQKHFNALT